MPWLLALSAGMAIVVAAATGPKADPDALRQAAMNNAGKADRGQAIFASATARCATCQVHGQGGDIGPLCLALPTHHAGYSLCRARMSGVDGTTPDGQNYSHHGAAATL